ncbi:MAG: hypothetical protein ACR2HG_00140 [Pyrinomonadaceae bacterium]
MKKLLNVKFIVAILAAFFVFGTVDGLAQRRKPVIRRKTVRRTTVVRPTTRLYSVERGTTFRVRMNETINSKTARVGDRFTTTVTEPVYSSTGVIVIPTGSTVTGRVDLVKPASKGGKPGEINASFIDVKLPNGTRRALNGSLTDLDSKSAKSDNESTASGDKMNHRKLIFIGGGGAGGAVLGGAIGGGKGALIGGIIGAVAGGITENQTKGENAEVKSGTEFSVYLNQSISLPKFAEANP